MFRKLIVAILILLIAPTAALAQVDNITQLNEENCSELEWQPLFDDLIQMLSNDEIVPDVAIDHLNRLFLAQMMINTVRAACTGYEFTSEEFPTGIIGPVAFMGVIYEGTLTIPQAGGFATMTFTSLSGDCGIIPMLTISSAETSDSSLFRFDQCTTMIEVNTQGPWTLSFSRIQ